METARGPGSQDEERFCTARKAVGRRPIKKKKRIQEPGADLRVQERGPGGALVRAESGKVGVGSGNAASLN